MLNMDLMNKINLFGSEREHGMHPIAKYFKCLAESKRCCNSQCINSRQQQKIISTTAIHSINQVHFNKILREGISKAGFCNICESDVTFKYAPSEGSMPDLLLYVVDGLQRIQYKDTYQGNEVHAYENELLKEQILFGMKYEVAAYTMYNGFHYQAVLWGQKRITYDGNGRPHLTVRNRLDHNAGVSAVWLVKSK